MSEVAINAKYADDRQNVNALLKAYQQKKTMFNPLVTNVVTNEIKEHTVANYLEQIKNNYYVSFKGAFLVARDLCSAKIKLNKEDWERLCENVPMGESTVRKYLKVGYDNRLMSMFMKGNLPWYWTTCYFLTTLTDNQLAALEEKEVLSPDCTIGQIKTAIDYKGNAEKVIQNFLSSFANLEVDKSKTHVAGFHNFVTGLKNYLKKYKFISLNTETKDGEDKVKLVEGKIKSFVEKQNKLKSKSKSKKRKSKKITSKD